MDKDTHKVISYMQCMRLVRSGQIKVGDTVFIKEMQTTFLVKAKDDLIAVSTENSNYKFIYNQDDLIQ